MKKSRSKNKLPAFNYRDWKRKNDDLDNLNDKIKNRLIYIADFYISQVSENKISRFDYNFYIGEAKRYIKNSYCRVRISIHRSGFTFPKRIQQVKLLVSKKSHESDGYITLYIPIKWLTNDFEDEFLSKLKLIRTFG